MVLPTYNRSALLRLAAGSFLRARVPEGVTTRLLVVDNNSHDDTAEMAQSFAGPSKGRIVYLFEGSQGRGNALNTGISHSDADIIAMFDDDETVDPGWLHRLAIDFADPGIDFVGGKVLPDWQAPPPPWLPLRYSGVIGHIDHGDEPRYFGEDGFDRMLVGGNTAIRRTMLDRCGPYPIENSYAEDRYMDAQLRRVGARGLYDPLLVVQHAVPNWRLTRKYYRHWAFTEGRTVGNEMDRAPPQRRLLLRAPRWMWRRALISVIDMITSFGTARAGHRFQAQLQLIEFWGFLTVRLFGLSLSYRDRTKFGPGDNTASRN